MAGRPLRRIRQLLRNGGGDICQHKDGCDKPVRYTVVVQVEGTRHARRLCNDHALDALYGAGAKFVEKRLVKKYGRFRDAAPWAKAVGMPTRFSPWVKYKRMRWLRVPVAADSPLVAGDSINVQGVQFPSWDETEILWGSARLEQDLGRVRVAQSGHKYRYAYIDGPNNWLAVYAKMTSTPVQ